MTRHMKRLSPKQVQHARPRGGETTVRLPDGGNLYLQATLGADGHVRRSWLFRYELDFQRHEIGLGPLHTVSLADARARAQELRQQLLQGVDPLAAKRQAKRERLAEKAAAAKAMTFEECARLYLASHSDSWRNAKHRSQWENTIRDYANPILGKLAVADIDTPHIIKVIEPLWRRVPETASRLRARIEAVLGYATVRGFRSGDNPARWRSHLKTILPERQKIQKTEHHVAMPYASVPDFMAELRQREGTAARALEFLILTAARTGETLGATWHEIDLKHKAWTIPASRMKSGREHRVPLSGPAMAILAGLPGHGRYVFGHKERLLDKSLLQVLRRMGTVSTVHGFRSAFRDWFAEQTNYPHELCEIALAHAVGNKVEAAYRRGDLLEKRRQLMESWARHCLSPVVSTADVLPMHRS